MCNQAPILLIYDRYLIGAPLLGAQTIPEAISQLDPACRFVKHVGQYSYEGNRWESYTVKGA